jgi:hypothetical protein
VLGKGWDSDLRIHHMFFRFPPLLLATYDLRLENNPMLYALCSLLFASFVASRPRGPLLELATGVAISTGGAYAGNCIP